MKLSLNTSNVNLLYCYPFQICIYIDWLWHLLDIWQIKIRFFLTIITILRILEEFYIKSLQEKELS